MSIAVLRNNHKRRPGRPPAADPREVVAVRLTLREQHTLDKFARRYGLSRSEMMREALYRLFGD
jgi:hypothetical protein